MGMLVAVHSTAAASGKDSRKGSRAHGLCALLVIRGSAHELVLTHDEEMRMSEDGAAPRPATRARRRNNQELRGRRRDTKEKEILEFTGLNWRRSFMIS